MTTASTPTPGPTATLYQPPTYQQALDSDSEQLRELRRRIGDPGAFTPRGYADDPYTEPLPAWSARAVALWLAERDAATDDREDPTR